MSCNNNDNNSNNHSNHWISEPYEYLEPKIGNVGFSARASKTIIQVFQETLRKHKHRHAMATKLQSYHEPVTLWDKFLCDDILDNNIDDCNIDVDDDDNDNIIALMTIMLLIIMIMIVCDYEITFVSNYHQNDDQIS